MLHLSTAKLRATPIVFLRTLAFINYLGYAGWAALLYNFTVERANFQWFETGLTQSRARNPGLPGLYRDFLAAGGPRTGAGLRGACHHGTGRRPDRSIPDARRRAHDHLHHVGGLPLLRDHERLPAAAAAAQGRGAALDRHHHGGGGGGAVYELRRTCHRLVGGRPRLCAAVLGRRRCLHAIDRRGGALVSALRGAGSAAKAHRTAPALLALLHADLHDRGAAAAVRCLRRVSVGEEVRLRRCRHGNADVGHHRRQHDAGPAPWPPGDAGRRTPHHHARERRF